MADILTAEQAIKETRNLKRSVLAEPVEVLQPKKRLDLHMLPMFPMKSSGRLSHWCDLIENSEDNIPVGDLKKWIENGAKGVPPGPFGFESAPEWKYKVSIYIIDKEGGGKDILKRFMFDDITFKPTRQEIKEICVGKAMEFDVKVLGKNPGQYLKTLDYMMNGLGGHQFRSVVLEQEAAPVSKALNRSYCDSAEKIDAAFDFVVKSFEDGDLEFKDILGQQRWILKQTSLEGPLKDWPIQMIEKAIETMQKKQALSLTIDDHPLTLAACTPTVLYILKQFYPTLHLNGMVWNGIPEIGKTPIARSVAMDQSRRNGGDSMTTSSEVDFYRQDRATKKKTRLYDDGDMSTLESKVMKAMLAVSAKDRSAWARWGGVRWAPGQCTHVIRNV